MLATARTVYAPRLKGERQAKDVRGGGRSGKFMPFSCLSSVETLPPSSFVLRLILGLTHLQSLSAYTGLFRKRLLGRDCASLSGHLGSWMPPKAKYIPECYSINVKQPGVRLSNIAERPFSRQQINGNSVACGERSMKRRKFTMLRVRVADGFCSIFSYEFPHHQCQFTVESHLHGAPVDPPHVFKSASATTVHLHNKFCIFHNPYFGIESCARQCGAGDAGKRRKTC